MTYLNIEEKHQLFEDYPRIEQSQLWQFTEYLKACSIYFICPEVGSFPYGKLSSKDKVLENPEDI